MVLKPAEAVEFPIRSTRQHKNRGFWSWVIWVVTPRPRWKLRSFRVSAQRMTRRMTHGKRMEKSKNLKLQPGSTFFLNFLNSWKVETFGKKTCYTHQEFRKMLKKHCGEVEAAWRQSLDPTEADRPWLVVLFVEWKKMARLANSTSQVFLGYWQVGRVRRGEFNDRTRAMGITGGWGGLWQSIVMTIKGSWQVNWLLWTTRRDLSWSGVFHGILIMMDSIHHEFRAWNSSPRVQAM